MNSSPATPAFWSQSAEDAFRRLRTGVFGLTDAEAGRRLAEGEVKLHCAVGLDGKANDDLLLHAFLNAHFQSGYTNPIDAAILAHRTFDVGEYRKLDEQPYDFIRKRLSVLVTCSGMPPR